MIAQYNTIHFKFIHILFVTFKIDSGCFIETQSLTLKRAKTSLLTRTNLGQDQGGPFHSWLSRLQQKCKDVSVMSSPAL